LDCWVPALLPVLVVLSVGLRAGLLLLAEVIVVRLAVVLGRALWVLLLEALMMMLLAMLPVALRAEVQMGVQ
jgi:hypothetical protein